MRGVFHQSSLRSSAACVSMSERSWNAAGLCAQISDLVQCCVAPSEFPLPLVSCAAMVDTCIVLSCAPDEASMKRTKLTRDSTVAAKCDSTYRTLGICARIHMCPLHLLYLSF